MAPTTTPGTGNRPVRSTVMGPRPLPLRVLPLLRACRPRQWLKNLLVFAAPGTAGALGDPRTLLLCAAAFVLFCAAPAEPTCSTTSATCTATANTPANATAPSPPASSRHRSPRPRGLCSPLPPRWPPSPWATGASPCC